MTHARWIVFAVLMVFVSIAAPVTAAEPELTGIWSMGVEGDHVVPMAMELKQDGGKLTGTIAMPINQQGDRRDIKIEGEVAGTTLKFSTVEGKPLLDFTGTVNDDGSLSGKVAAGPEHTMAWTAERLKTRKKGE